MKRTIAVSVVIFCDIEVEKFDEEDVDQACQTNDNASDIVLSAIERDGFKYSVMDIEDVTE